MTAVAAFLPVGLDLAWNQRNPFFWLLDQRFAHGNAFSTLSQVGQAGGVFSLSNMVALVAQFHHVSSLNPVLAFPPYLVDILLWATVGACVILYSVSASLFRGRPTEGYILILFVLFLMFAFAYPAKRYYFFLYAAVPFAILLGGTVSKMVAKLNASGWFHGGRRIAIPLLAGLILVMSITAIGMNVAAVPTVYQSGFGDWDEMGRIMTYMKMNEQTNSSIATNLVPVFYYSNLYGISLQVVPLQTPVLYSTESPQQQILQTPIKPGYPYVWVISAASIQQLQPQFIVMSQTDFAGTTLAFRQYVQSHYYQPLGTKLVLLFERDGVYADSQLGGS
ncbi:MAG: hypothetical protein M1368_10615, partial [Thaumarchaeota archaeon]|nr:hypothetical protein [Nitrososphaerota archaeon]